MARMLAAGQEVPMSARVNDPVAWGRRVPVAIPTPPAKGEARLLAGLLVLCLVWVALALVGAVALGCWLWPDRVVIGQLVFWLTIAGLLVVAARVVISELGKGRR